jgi:uncharacterized membrane protein YidH (DUF202 family)
MSQQTMTTLMKWTNKGESMSERFIVDTIAVFLIIIIIALGVLAMLAIQKQNDAIRSEFRWCTDSCEPLNVKSCENGIAVCGDYTVRKKEKTQ